MKKSQAKRVQLAQQGDVLLFGCDGPPKGARSVSDKIIAHGESTGHSHRVATEDATVVEHDGTMYVIAPSGVDIVHEEHGTVSLPAGTYRVGRVREYCHFEEEAREVRD